MVEVYNSGDTLDRFQVIGDITNGKALLSLSGEMDLGNYLEAGKYFDSVVENPNVTDSVIDIDMSQLDFLDSSGLSAILSFSAKLEAQQKRVVVINPNRDVLKIFEITGLKDFFIADSTE